MKKWKIVLKYRRKKEKSVLGRPWTKRMVLRAISSTLKCQFTGKHEKLNIWLFGETEHRAPGLQMDTKCVSAHFCRAKTPSIAI